MDPKDPKDPENPGNPGGNPPGNPDPNIVALQQKLSERTLELKKAQEALAEASKAKGNTDETSAAITLMGETIKKLSDTITKMEDEKHREELRAKYPDIVPELLIGRNNEDIERLVEAQRKNIEKEYVRQPSAHAPKFATKAEVEQEITRLEGDKTIPVIEKFAKLRALKEERDEF